MSRAEKIMLTACGLVLVFGLFQMFFKPDAPPPEEDPAAATIRREAEPGASDGVSMPVFVHNTPPTLRMVEQGDYGKTVHREETLERPRNTMNLVMRERYNESRPESRFQQPYSGSEYMELQQKQLRELREQLTSPNEDDQDARLNLEEIEDLKASNKLIW